MQTRLVKQTEIMQESIKYLKTIGYEVNWEYSPNKNNAVKTLCRITKEGEEHLGLSKKNVKDSPNLKLARYVSFQRAIKDVNGLGQ